MSRRLYEISSLMTLSRKTTLVLAWFVFMYVWK